MSEGAVLSPTEAIDAVRLVLRGGGWWRLEDGDRFYIHVGPGYDVYIGVDSTCDHSVELAKENGVFVVRDCRRRTEGRLTLRVIPERWPRRPSTVVAAARSSDPCRGAR